MRTSFNQLEACAILGKDKATLQKWIKNGAPAEKVNGKWQISIPKMFAWRIEYERALAVGSDGELLNAEQENAALAKARRKKVELETAEKEGELTNFEDVAERWQKVIYAAKNKFLSIGARLAPVLPVKTDPHEIKEMIDAACYEALDELTLD